jgi:hypothetical protein
MALLLHGIESPAEDVVGSLSGSVSPCLHGAPRLPLSQASVGADAPGETE